MCVCVWDVESVFFSPFFNGGKEYLDILSIGIIKSCLLELILADRSERKERELERERVREVAIERESERAVMSTPWGEQRPPVSRLLYRLPPFLSPPPPFLPSPVFSRYLAHFLSLYPSLACFLKLILYPLILYFKQLPHTNLRTQTHKHTLIHTNSHVPTNTHRQHQGEPSCSKPEAKSWSFIQMNVYFFYCQDVCICHRVYMCMLRERGNGTEDASVHVLVCVTCTAEEEGLTVGDKPDRPARCDYHPLDPLSHTHTRTFRHTHLHTQCPMRESVWQGFRIGQTWRQTNRQRSLGSQARWKAQEKQMNRDWRKKTMHPIMFHWTLIVFFGFYVSIFISFNVLVKISKRFITVDMQDRRL